MKKLITIRKCTNPTCNNYYYGYPQHKYCSDYCLKSVEHDKYLKKSLIKQVERVKKVVYHYNRIHNSLITGEILQIITRDICTEGTRNGAPIPCFGWEIIKDVLVADPELKVDWRQHHTVMGMKHTVKTVKETTRQRKKARRVRKNKRSRRLDELIIEKEIEKCGGKIPEPFLRNCFVDYYMGVVVLRTETDKEICMIKMGEKEMPTRIKRNEK